MDRNNLIAYILSVVAIATYMFHFWWPGTVGAGVLWSIAGGCAIGSIYHSLSVRGKTEEATKWMLDAAFVLGCIVLIGLAISASVLLVPAIK
jgi:hypothetical protein